MFYVYIEQVHWRNSMWLWVEEGVNRRELIVSDVALVPDGWQARGATWGR